MSVNRVMLCGNLGTKPELKVLSADNKVCTFSMATSYTAANGTEAVTWHRIVVWGKRAEPCAKYLDKGSKVFVEGRISSRDYEKDGQKRTAYEIVADSVQFLTKPNQDGQQQYQPKAPAPVATPPAQQVDWNDMPF